MDLSDLRREGWFLAPGETLEDLLARKRVFEQEGPSSSPLLEKAGKITESLYGFRLKEVPIFLSRKSLFPWQGGMLWSYFTKEGKCFPKIQMRKTYSKLYDPSEILAHELVHVARFAFKEPFFEEILAYKTSKSAFRRVLGPLFLYPAESVIFMLLSTLGAFCFVWLDSFFSFFLFFIFFMWLFLRLSCLHLLFNKALRKLKIRGEKEPVLGLMLGLSDKEILAIALK